MGRARQRSYRGKVFLVHSVFHGSEAGLGLVAQMYVSQRPLTGSAQEQQVSARKKKSTAVKI
jgi:hypothetical protein